MISKPAVLECTRCGKIFIGWETGVRPKGGPMCLRCQARRAWDVLASTVSPKKRRSAGGKRSPVRKPANASAARERSRKRAVANQGKRSRAKPGP